MQDKSTVQITAVRGIYNSKGETLKLDRNIELTSSTGYAGHLSEATVDIRKGHVVSNQAGRGEAAARHAQRQPAGDHRTPATWCASAAASA